MDRHDDTSRRGNPLNPIGAADNMFPDPHIKIFVNPDTGKENMYVYAGHEGGRDPFIMRDWYVRGKRLADVRGCLSRELRLPGALGRPSAGRGRQRKMRCILPERPCLRGCFLR